MSCYCNNIWFDSCHWPCGIPAQWPAWEQRPVWPPCPPYPPVYGDINETQEILDDDSPTD